MSSNQGDVANTFRTFCQMLRYMSLDNACDAVSSLSRGFADLRIPAREWRLPFFVSRNISISALDVRRRRPSWPDAPTSCTPSGRAPSPASSGSDRAGYRTRDPRWSRAPSAQRRELPASRSRHRRQKCRCGIALSLGQRAEIVDRAHAPAVREELAQRFARLAACDQGARLCAISVAMMSPARTS
jgi:hypothetical protein